MGYILSMKDIEGPSRYDLTSRLARLRDSIAKRRVRLQKELESLDLIELQLKGGSHAPKAK